MLQQSTTPPPMALITPEVSDDDIPVDDTPDDDWDWDDHPSLSASERNPSLR